MQKLYKEDYLKPYAVKSINSTGRIYKENENKRLNSMINSHSSAHRYSGLIPEDTLDLALFVSIAVLIIYLGKTIWKK